MTVIILESALGDLLEATAYFEEQSVGLGLRFRRCVENSIEGIIDFPKASAIVRKGYRICQVSRFRKYGILYRLKRGCIFIHGIIHLQRGPRFWRERLH